MKTNLIIFFVFGSFVFSALNYFNLGKAERNMTSPSSPQIIEKTLEISFANILRPNVPESDRSLKKPKIEGMYCTNIGKQEPEMMVKFFSDRAEVWPINAKIRDKFKYYSSPQATIIKFDSGKKFIYLNLYETEEKEFHYEVAKIISSNNEFVTGFDIGGEIFTKENCKKYLD